MLLFKFIDIVSGVKSNMYGSYDIDVQSPIAAKLYGECETLMRAEPSNVVELHDLVHKLFGVRNWWTKVDQNKWTPEDEIVVQKKIAFTGLRLKKMKEKLVEEAAEVVKVQFDIVDTLLRLANLDRQSLPMDFEKLALSLFRVRKAVAREREQEDLLRLKLLIQSTKQSFDELNIPEHNYIYELLQHLLRLLTPQTKQLYAKRSKCMDNLIEAMLESIDEHCEQLSDAPIRIEPEGSLLMSTSSSSSVAEYQQAPNAESYCELCQVNDHCVESCPKYVIYEQRLERARILKLCLKCLQKNHLSRNCKFSGVCNICKGAHRSTMCKRTFFRAPAGPSIKIKSMSDIEMSLLEAIKMKLDKI